MSARKNSRLSSDRHQEMDDLIKGLPPRSGAPRQVRRWGRFFLKIMIILAILTGTVYGVNLLWHKFVVTSQQFQLKSVQFATNGHMTEEEVRKILGLTGQENVLFLNIEKLEEKLKKRSDIVNVFINRELPATLVIELEERVPVAWLECPQDNLFAGNKQTGLFVDASGHVFSYDPELHKRYESSPVIRVAPPGQGHYTSGSTFQDVSPRQGISFLRTSKAFVQEGLPLVTSIDFVNDWSFIAHFADGMEITFGLYDHERQLHDLALVVKHANATNRSIKSANMMPARNMPVVFGPKRETSIVQAEIVDEEGSAEVVNVPEKPVDEKAGDNKPALVVEIKKETKDKLAQEKKEDKKESSRKPSVKKPASRAVAAVIVDDEDDAPKRKSGVSTKQSSAKSPSTKKKSASSEKESSQRKATKPKPTPSSETKKSSGNKSSSGKTSSRKSSSGNNASGSQKQQTPSGPKPVEVPSFNW